MNDGKSCKFGLNSRFCKQSSNSYVGPGTYETRVIQLKKLKINQTFSNTPKNQIYFNLNKLKSIPGPGNYEFNHGVHFI